MKWLLRCLFFWEWLKRWRCHGNIAPCPKFHHWKEWDEQPKKEKELIEDAAKATEAFSEDELEESAAVWKKWNEQ